MGNLEGLTYISYRVLYPTEPEVLLVNGMELLNDVQFPIPTEKKLLLALVVQVSSEPGEE